MNASDNAQWHNAKRGEAHTQLTGVFRTVREESEWRVDADEYHLGLYAASDQPGVRGNSRRGYDYGPATLPYNVCRAAVDTLQSKVAKHRPLPQCLTQKGNWKQQKRARKMTQFLEGEFYRQRIFEKQAQMIVRDALIFGRGILKVWAEGKRIKTERAHPWEIFTDEWDARYGTPRNLYHCRSVDKGVLLQQFARTEAGGWSQTIKAAIETAGRFDLEDNWNTNGGCTVDRVDIIEAWHLCDRPEEHERAEDAEEPSDEPDDAPTEEPKAEGEQPKKHQCNGRHVVITTTGTLIDEPWEEDYFPYAVLNYNEAVVGCWGHGLIEQLEGYQYELNLTSERLSEMFRLSGVHVFVPDSAKISYQDIRNGIQVTGHAPGGEPKVFQMDLVNEHMRQRPRELTEDALNDCGLSQMSVQSEKPAGVTAAVAIQTLDDIETERFAIFGRAYEAWCLEVARRFIDGAKQIASAYGDHAVSVPMKGGILKLRWTDVYVDGVEIRVFPTSLLPQQLAARLETLQGLWEKQLIDRATFLRHLDAPDMQAEMDLETADRLVVDEMLDRMLEAEEDEGDSAYYAPSEYQQIFTNDNGMITPGWAPKRAQQKYNRALLDGAPEYNLDFLQRFMKDCQKIIDTQKAANAPPAVAGTPAMPAGLPPAPSAPMAGATPISNDMAPTAPGPMQPMAA